MLNCCSAAEVEKGPEEGVVAGVLDFVDPFHRFGAGSEGEEGDDHGHSFIQLFVTGAAHRVDVWSNTDSAAGVATLPFVGAGSGVAVLPAADVSTESLAEHHSVVTRLAVVEPELVRVELAEVDLEGRHADFPVGDAQSATAEELGR